MYTNKGLKYREEEKCSGKGVSCGWVTLLASRNDYNMWTVRLSRYIKEVPGILVVGIYYLDHVK